MLAYLIVGLIAACAAAPHYPYGSPHEWSHHRSRHGPHHGDLFSGEMFDTRQFWAEMANEMRQLDAMLSQFYQRFPMVTSTQGVVDGQYKITIPLHGFQEKEIVVKAREGLLMVQAVHAMPGGGQNSYLDVKTLPACVNVTGSWNFEKDVLTIIFPLKEGSEVESEDNGEKETITEAPVTEHSREELSPGEESSTESNVDVGVDRGDLASVNNEILTNEIRTSVEATTYAVDLNDQYEFVPVRY